MVVSSPTVSKALLLGLQAGERLAPLFQFRQPDPDPRSMGILAFEVGRTMSRLVGLHRALSDHELHRLVSTTLSSEGVAYLNSSDKRTLLRRACAEKIDDLDAAAAAVARLGRRCGGVWPIGFDNLYSDLREGTGELCDHFLGFTAKDMEKNVKKLEKYVAATSALYDAMEDLAQMETLELRQKRSPQNSPDSSESLKKRIKQTRSTVRQLKEDSLWNRSFEKAAELMARTIISIFAQLCVAYRFVVPELPRVKLDWQGRVKITGRYSGETRNLGGIYSSGPLERPPVENLRTRNSGPLLRPKTKDDEDERSWKARALKPPENSLGAIGMARRYAEVVVFVEKLAVMPESVVEKARDELYRKLPHSLRRSVMAKLKSHRNFDDGVGPSEALADGWREAVNGILRWLGPVARDTLLWQSERSLENREMNSTAKVLMTQTMIFSDREKAEASIVELLVAFSHVCRYT